MSENGKNNDTKKTLKEFLTDKNTAELISSIDENTRNCVTEISALCEMLELSSNEEERKYVKGILENCRRIMRQNEVIALLSEALNSENTCITELSQLIEELIEGIKETTGISVIFTDKTEADLWINGSKTTNLYLMLYVVRKLLRSAKNAEKLEITSEKADNSTVKITLKLTSESQQKEIKNNDEYFEKELPQLLCEALNAEISEESDSSTVIAFETAVGDNKLKLSSNRIIIGRSIFSPYDVMLTEEEEETDF